MRRLLLALPIALAPQAVAAMPPSAGTIYTFVDPIFTGTIICDTYEQVREIATADQPGEVYLTYLATPNQRNEPTCALVAPTGVVLDVRPVGILNEAGQEYHAYAVEAQFGAAVGFALFLEAANLVRV